MGTKGSFALFLFVFSFLLPLAFAQLRPGFYSTTCPKAESIVFSLVQKRFNADKSVTAALLRMHFHDCFVTGCDASILIDSTSQNAAEKEAGANQTVRELELIDQIKKALEAECPSTVSCADIITLATRDSVALAGGPPYTVPTGRRDGLRSSVDDVDLPGPSSSVSEAQRAFQAKGLTSDEMVTLLGAHTVGFAHCSFFDDRLTNFEGTGRPDPMMNVSLVTKLTGICSSASSDSFGPKTFLDQNTNLVFDNKFYGEILSRRGILQIDQELALDRSTAQTVTTFASNEAAFQGSFANAMVKMGSIQVLVRNAGEIRQDCRAFNPPRKPPSPNPTPSNPSPSPSPRPRPRPGPGPGPRRPGKGGRKQKPPRKGGNKKIPRGLNDIM